MSTPVASAAPPGRGILVIVSSPSGAGKTTLTRRLLGEFPWMRFSVSYTTRPMRPGEIDGVDYHFVDAATFAAMAARGEFAEHAEVHGNHYGTARAPIEAALQAGQDVVFDVDWQGSRDLFSQWPADALKLFILPPDLDTLAHRLRRRATDPDDVIERRLRKAIDELGHWNEYQFLVVNDDVDRAYALLRAIYLLRRFGPPFVDDRPGVAFPLGALCRVVVEALIADPVSHAMQLSGARPADALRGGPPEPPR